MYASPRPMPRAPMPHSYEGIEASYYNSERKGFETSPVIKTPPIGCSAWAYGLGWRLAQHMYRAGYLLTWR